MLKFLLPILFFASLGGVLYILYKKVSALADIPLDSIQNKETFFAFLQRIFRSFFSHVNIKKIKIFFLVFTEKILLRFKATSLKIYNMIEMLSKDVKQRSQQEKWEHHWFFHGTDRETDVKKDKESENKQ